MEDARANFDPAHPRQIAEHDQNLMAWSQINIRNTQMIGERACSYVRVYV